MVVSRSEHTATGRPVQAEEGMSHRNSLITVWYPCQCGLQVRDCHQRLLTQSLFWQALGIWPMCVVITTTIWPQTISYPFRWPRLLFWPGFLHSKTPMNLVIPPLADTLPFRSWLSQVIDNSCFPHCSSRRLHASVNRQHLHRVLRQGRETQGQCVTKR